MTSGRSRMMCSMATGGRSGSGCFRHRMALVKTIWASFRASKGKRWIVSASCRRRSCSMMALTSSSICAGSLSRSVRSRQPRVHSLVLERPYHVSPAVPPSCEQRGLRPSLHPSQCQQRLPPPTPATTHLVFQALVPPCLHQRTRVLDILGPGRSAALAEQH